MFKFFGNLRRGPLLRTTKPDIYQLAEKKKKKKKRSELSSQIEE